MIKEDRPSIPSTATMGDVARAWAAKKGKIFPTSLSGMALRLYDEFSADELQQWLHKHRGRKQLAKPRFEDIIDDIAGLITDDPDINH